MYVGLLLSRIQVLKVHLTDLDNNAMRESCEDALLYDLLFAGAVKLAGRRVWGTRFADDLSHAQEGPTCNSLRKCTGKHINRLDEHCGELCNG